jgi:hypothetical protein
MADHAVRCIKCAKAHFRENSQGVYEYVAEWVEYAYAPMTFHQVNRLTDMVCRRLGLPL